MANRGIHVVPSGEGWAVEVPDGGAHSIFVTQEEAIAAGTELAKREKAELLIHGRDGRIRVRESFCHGRPVHRG
ncbi:DUF2188 domain-containing protein [Cupriavidus pauculus]|uniref:DUF2188 domain-containing protein n=1 Tax=Cupriavidus pauculus TaxID=82633 RepID=A0A3G8H9J6_9BURK|nr:DUF2188 domain-containing protein [Cupriavidus pauculus]AZG17144.1 DUF2188 domain-containing protein [Cupriavidus pauculus]